MSFKKRAGFGKIVMPDLNTYQFNSSSDYNLILYSEDDTKTVISYDKVWDKVEDSDEFKKAEGDNPCWKGKHKTGPEFASFGKRKARELFRKYCILTK